jgi:hypothetical protein
VAVGTYNKCCGFYLGVCVRAAIAASENYFFMNLINWCAITFNLDVSSSRTARYTIYWYQITMGVGSIQILGGSQPVAYLEMGDHIDGHKKIDDHFWEANICRPHFRRTTNLATFFLITFSHSHPSDPSERVEPSALPPVFKPFKKFSYQPRGAMAQWPP